jgi:hypothetical protein
MRGSLIAVAAVLSLCAVALVASLAGYLTHRETANVHVAPVANLPADASSTPGAPKVSAPPIDGAASNPPAPAAEVPPPGPPVQAIAKPPDPAAAAPVAPQGQAPDQQARIDAFMRFVQQQQQRRRRPPEPG